MGITVEEVAQRIYLLGDTYPVKDRIKQLGGHWDGERKAWWVGKVKQADVASLVTELASKPQTPAARMKESPDTIRLTGKGKYKGRTYYAGAVTKDGMKVRLLTLPDANGDYLDFWADCSQVEEVKRYQPREVWNGRRGGGTVTQYTTLGSIADFIAKEKKNKANGGEVCAECGKSGGLVCDLEDGLMKHRHCCDIEP